MQTFNRKYFVKNRLFNHEMTFIERLLTDDIRNNSAWNHRFFVVSHEVRKTIFFLFNNSIGVEIHIMLKNLYYFRCAQMNHLKMCGLKGQY